MDQKIAPMLAAPMLQNMLLWKYFHYDFLNIAKDSDNSVLTSF